MGAKVSLGSGFYYEYNSRRNTLIAKRGDYGYEYSWYFPFDPGLKFMRGVVAINESVHNMDRAMCTKLRYTLGREFPSEGLVDDYDLLLDREDVFPTESYKRWAAAYRALNPSPKPKPKETAVPKRSYDLDPSQITFDNPQAPVPPVPKTTTTTKETAVSDTKTTMSTLTSFLQTPEFSAALNGLDQAASLTATRKVVDVVLKKIPEDAKFLLDLAPENVKMLIVCTALISVTRDEVTGAVFPPKVREWLHARAQAGATFAWAKFGEDILAPIVGELSALANESMEQ